MFLFLNADVVTLRVFNLPVTFFFLGGQMRSKSQSERPAMGTKLCFPSRLKKIIKNPSCSSYFHLSIFPRHTGGLWEIFLVVQSVETFFFFPQSAANQAADSASLSTRMTWTTRIIKMNKAEISQDCVWQQQRGPMMLLVWWVITNSPKSHHCSPPTQERLLRTPPSPAAGTT